MTLFKRCECEQSIRPLMPSLVRRLVHPDKCSHAQAKDASAAVNQVGIQLQSESQLLPEAMHQ